MSFLYRFFTFLLLFITLPVIVISGDSVNFVWFANHKTVSLVDTTANEVINSVNISDSAEALVIDPVDFSLFALSKKTLLKFDSSGNLVLNLDFKKLVKGIGEPKHLALNPYDRSVWVAAEKTLLRLDNNGRLLLKTKAQEAIKALDLDQNENLYVLGESSLTEIAKTGNRLRSLSLDPILSKPVDIAVDSVGNAIWIAGEQELARINRGDFSLAPLIINTIGENRTLTLNPKTGMLWVLNKDAENSDAHTINIYNRSGNLTQTIDLSRYKINTIAFDPLTGSFFVGAKGALLSLSSSGDIIAQIPVKGTGNIPGNGRVDSPGNSPAIAGKGNDTVKAIGVVPFYVTPGISLVEPADGSLTNNPKPLMEYSLNAFCNGGLCEPENYFSKFTLNIGLNDEPVGSLFTIDGNSAAYTPTERLAEGLNILSAEATDGFAHPSNRVDSSFTIDTIPPQFITITPGNGSMVTDSEIIISGSVDDPEGMIYLKSTSALESETISSGPEDFSYRATLNSGDNSFIFCAYDPAGNEACETIIVQYYKEADEDDLPPDPALVASPIDPTVATTIQSATEFLYTGENPIQTSVEPDAIKPELTAVLRGIVKASDGSPLSGVKIIILHRPEFGGTISRADGMFDMVVNGGGWMTVDYQKDGYLTVQRKVDAPWQDYAYLPDVVMTTYDDKVTTIDLSQNIPIQVAEGSVVTDSDGTRKATLLFKQATEAVMTLPDGSTRTLSNINVRATEFTVGDNGPNAMPAPLPPASGYTYAVEYSIDEAVLAGAKEVTFTKPVISYTENFLNFPVGGIVPAGYYDRKKDVWVPLDNGIVIKILGVTGGIAALDIDGTGVPATASALTLLGITDEERQTLATLYQTGQSLWRVAVSHFSAYDWNWPWGPPDDSEEPDLPEPSGGDEVDNPNLGCGSIIENENCTLGEEIDITGSALSLNYRSDRTPGRKAGYTIKIPVSGFTVPASLKRIDLEIMIAGRLFKESFGPAVNQTYTFTWDGKDAYNNNIE